MRDPDQLDLAHAGRPHSLERTGFATLAAALLAPVVAHGLWRPLVHVFGPAGEAATITLASLALGLLVAGVHHLLGGRPLGLRLLIGGGGAVGLALGFSLGAPGLVCLLVVAGAMTALMAAMGPRLPSTLDGLARPHKILTLLYVAAALVAVASTARLSTFMGDPDRVDLSTLPGDTFVEPHSCLTAYVHGAALARQDVDNLYDDRWWLGSLGLPALPPGVENPYHPFHLDNFSYPPPFLLLMAPLGPLDGDFFAQRALWFGLNGLVFALGLWVVACWLEGPGVHRTLLLAPLLFGSLPILLVFQIGNFQIATITLSVLAMVSFERGRHATGGALLAGTILSKISPGVFGIVLLLQRRFRSAALTAGCGALFLAVTVWVLGTEPLWSFLTYALPRLNSGASFPFMGTPDGIATNLSPFGFAFKLPLLGVAVGDPWRLGQTFARIYTGVLLVLALVAARRRGDRRDRALTWMALLVLAALQSPFSPGYAALALLWATTLLAAEVRGLRGAMGIVFVWLMVILAIPDLSDAQKAVQSLAQTTAIFGTCAWLLLRAPRGPEVVGATPNP